MGDHVYTLFLFHVHTCTHAHTHICLCHYIHLYECKGWFQAIFPFSDRPPQKKRVIIQPLITSLSARLGKPPAHPSWYSSVNAASSTVVTDCSHSTNLKDSLRRPSYLQQSILQRFHCFPVHGRHRDSCKLNIVTRVSFYCQLKIVLGAAVGDSASKCKLCVHVWSAKRLRFRACRSACDSLRVLAPAKTQIL